MIGMTGEERRKITECEGKAYHEGAHAIVYHHLGVPLQEVTIDHVTSPDDCTASDETRIMCRLAGAVMDGKLGRDRSHRDRLMAYLELGSLAPMGDEAAFGALHQCLYEKTKAIIQEPRNRAAIEAVARMLRGGHTLEGPQAYQVIEQALREAKGET
jgi:hypothetical protein